MDFLDPQKIRRHNIILMVGYIFIGVAILVTTVVMLYLAYGFGLGKDGEIIQNGLVFFSSHPSNASIYIDGTKKTNTGARLVIAAGSYNVMLQKDGYRSWQKTLKVEGGAVQHVAYPFLFPSVLTTTELRSYAAAPVLTTESPDNHWLLVQPAGSVATFEKYDLSSSTSVAKPPVTLTLPASVITSATGPQKIQVVAWADDNRHVLLTHTYDTNKMEYILLDQANPSSSVNLTQTLKLTVSQQLTLQNDKYDNYYVYDQQAQSLGQASLGQPSVTPLLLNVLAYKAFGSDTIVYVTSASQPAGKVEAMFRQGGQDYPLQSFPAKDTYELAVSEYDGDWFAAVGAASKGTVYLYKNPAYQYGNNPGHTEIPLSILHVAAPSVVSFSPRSQFVAAEHGTQFAVYDVENDQRYAFTTSKALDKPQSSAEWMDGSHFEYVSGGQLVVVDYDGTNLQVLMSADAPYVPAYDPAYRYVYALAPNATGKQTALTSTALLIPADL